MPQFSATNMLLKMEPNLYTNFFIALLTRVYVSSSAPQSERNELTLLVLQDSRRLASTHSTATTLLGQDGSLVSRGGGREVGGRGSSHGGLPVLVVANLDLSPFLTQNKCFGAGGRTNLGHDQIVVT